MLTICKPFLRSLQDKSFVKPLAMADAGQISIGLDHSFFVHKGRFYDKIRHTPFEQASIIGAEKTNG